MHLATAIAMTLLRSALVVAALMALLFGGSLLISEAGPSVREQLEAPERLEELEQAGYDHTAIIAERHAESAVHRAQTMALRARLQQERSSWQVRLEEDLRAIEEAADEQIERVEQSMEESRQAMIDSVDRLEARYCDSWNPVHWWTCRTIKERANSMEERVAAQREAVEKTAQRLRQQAVDEAAAYRADAEQRLQDQTAQLEDQLQSSLEAMDDLEAQRQKLEERIDEIQQEEALLRERTRLWVEFRDRWPHLLVVALLIFAAPYLRRTLWYYVGMPLVSRASPIELSSPAMKKKEKDNPTPRIQCGDSHRTLELEVPAGGQLLTRIGYVQSDRKGARSEIFFDRDSPNLSYISGLVLLTRLQSHRADEEPRQVMLGTPDDPDAYLMRIDLEDHPGVVLRASHVVGVVGDIQIDSTWRLGNLHAWATSQVRFITFSGTGTLILEGYGDVQGLHLDGERQRKRMSLVVGFDTRLTYQTERTATFLPYLVDPGREPLVVDVFDGTGTVFFEKNPSARKRHRTTGEAIAGFFLDAIRRLLGL